MDGDRTHEIRRHLLLGRKAVTNIDSILKSRDVTLLTNVCIFKAIVSPVVMFPCKSWTIKKAEHWRIDAFKRWCWRTLESPLDSKKIKPVNPKGNQPWIFIGRTDAEAESPILWLPDELTHWKIPWCWERLKAKGEGDDRGWDGYWIASLTQWTWIWANSVR